MLSKKNSMVTMVTDEFLENCIILQKSVATIGFICFFLFQKCILLYIFAQVFLVMRSIRSHISLFRLGFTPTLNPQTTLFTKEANTFRRFFEEKKRKNKQTNKKREKRKEKQNKTKQTSVYSQ